jgi:predicted RND superfamily exporter protein
LSADFVIHFSFAYTQQPPNTDRHIRTEHALLHLGPSMLAAGFTTLMGSTMMFFTEIFFFHLFGYVLLFTIVQATLASFVLFLAMTDCIGPSNPTYLFDLLVGKVSACCLGWQKETTKEEAK